MNNQRTTALGAVSRHVTRRSFLRASVAAGIAVTGVATLSACTGDDDDDSPGSSSKEAFDATLKVTDAGPYRALPDKAARAEQPGLDAYATALEAWLTDNPGVKLETVNADVWNKDAMVTAIAGGTAPAIYYANVLGFWSPVFIRQAFAQGLCADVTDLVAEHKMVDRLSQSARPIWERSWKLNDKYYAAPKTYGVGNGVHYRRDLVEELGLPEPKPGWTWADLRALAKGLMSGKRRGIMMQRSPMNAAAAECEAMELLSKLPTPDTSWNWTFDYTLHADQFAAAIENIRAMRYEDESAIGDISLADDPWKPREAFSRQEVAMHVNPISMLVEQPGQDPSPPKLAEALGKPIDEVIGWAVMPAGINGHGKPSMAKGGIDSVAFSPDLDDDELGAAFSLHMHMISDGLIMVKQAVYDQDQDLTRVYQPDAITPVLTEVEGKLPGSPEEAWGERIMAAVKEAAAVPPQPSEEWFIPTEENPGPGDEVRNDALSKWWYEKATPDIDADLRNIGEVRNQQAESFSSSVSDDDFAAGAKEYYEAHAKYWQEHSPDFYTETFQPWYEEHVKPKIS